MISLIALTYDEAGGLRETSNSSSGTLFTQDGDGLKSKMLVEGSPTHYLRSSVLRDTIAEIEPDGSRKNGFVLADGRLIATQAVGADFLQHTDASGKSRRTTLTGGGGHGRDEVDPMDVKLDPPNLHQFNQGSGGGGKSAGGADARVASLMDLRMCDFAGMLVPCGIKESLRDHVGQSPRELGLFWEYGWWSGASYGTAYTYYATHNPFKLLDLHREQLRRGQMRLKTPPKLSYPKPMTKAEREKKLRENSGVGADENEPQNPASNTAQQFDWSLFWDLLVAMNALKKQACRDLFGSNVDPSQLLGNLAAGNAGLGSITRGDVGGVSDGRIDAAQTTGILGSRTVTRPDGTTFRQTTWTGANIVLNNNSAALPYQGSYGDYLRVGASDTVYRAITLIHELGHAAARIYGVSASRMLDDKTNPGQSRSNSQLVYDNCFK